MYWKKEKMGDRILEFYPRYMALLSRERRLYAVHTLLTKLKNNFGRATISYLLASLSRVESDFGDDMIKDLDTVYETHVVTMYIFSSFIINYIVKFIARVPWLRQRLSRIIIKALFSLCDYKNCTSDAVWRFLSKFDRWSLEDDIIYSAQQWLSVDVILCYLANLCFLFYRKTD